LIGSQRKRYRATVADAAGGMNPNDAVTSNYSRLDKIAIAITGKVGTMKFALVIISWTFFWLAYNGLAGLIGFTPFDSMPALVAYLLISNVIQICLMPLIMVAQNMDSRHSEALAEQDHIVNKATLKALTMVLTALDDGRLDKRELNEVKSIIEQVNLQ
jgi:uncharacterized membrane protein